MSCRIYHENQLIGFYNMAYIPFKTETRAWEPSFVREVRAKSNFKRRWSLCAWVGICSQYGSSLSFGFEAAINAEYTNYLMRPLDKNKTSDSTVIHGFSIFGTYILFKFKIGANTVKKEKRYFKISEKTNQMTIWEKETN